MVVNSLAAAEPLVVNVVNLAAKRLVVHTPKCEYKVFHRADGFKTVGVAEVLWQHSLPALCCKAFESPLQTCYILVGVGTGKASVLVHSLTYLPR